MKLHFEEKPWIFLILLSLGFGYQCFVSATMFHVCAFMTAQAVFAYGAWRDTWS